MSFAAFCGKKDHRDRGKPGRLANGATDVEAIFTRNHDIEDEEGGALSLGVGEDGCAGGEDAHCEAIVFEMMSDQARNVRIVFEYEDAGFHEFILSEAVRST